MFKFILYLFLLIITIVVSSPILLLAGLIVVKNLIVNFLIPKFFYVILSIICKMGDSLMKIDSYIDKIEDDNSEF
jgi:hypothetical protein